MRDKTLFERQSALSVKADIGMYYCGKRVKTKDHEYGPEIRGHYLFVFVNEGEATLYGEKVRRLKKHDLFVMLPGEKIHYKAHTPWSIQWVGLYGQTVDAYVRSLGITRKDPVLSVDTAAWEIEKLLNALYEASEKSTQADSLYCISLIYRFFSVLFASSEHKESIDHVASALKMIDYNLNTEMSVDSLARALHLAPSYFARLFKERCGVSPKRYMLEKRMERAKELLADPEISVFEVARSLGFSDSLYFSRIFKKYVRKSPSDYRQAIGTNTK